MTLDDDNASGVRSILGTLDIDAAGALRQALLDCIIHKPAIEVNLSGIEDCDTAALQVLLAGQRDGSLRITGSSPAVTEIAAALGLSENLHAN